MEPQKSIFHEFIEGGWIIALIGTAAMIARILSVDERSTIVENLKKIATATISSAIVWALLHGLSIPDFYEAIIYGITGVISPEVIQGLVKLSKRFSKNPEDYIRGRR